jgi:ABC-type Fe3+/spermidine/putrescine transport system ATPase subunit
MVKLLGKEGRMPAQLSGGEQQRVALARALVNKPAVVLLDEPLAALDQQLRQAMQVELKSIQEQAGLTCVCVTHHQEEAMMMSDRIAVMHQGRMWQVGSPREVYERPCNLFVSRFLGVSNELPGTIGASVGEDRVFQPDDRTGAAHGANREHGTGRPFSHALAPAGTHPHGAGTAVDIRPGALRPD